MRTGQRTMTPGGQIPPAAPAGLLRRLAALAYDLLLLAGVLMISSYAVIIARGGTSVPAGNLAYQVFVLAQIAAYFTAFWTYGGQTPGMRAWRIRVERQGGGLPKPGAALLRLAVALISAAAFGLGFFWVLIDRDRRSWHDLASGTCVTLCERAPLH